MNAERLRRDVVKRVSRSWLNVAALDSEQISKQIEQFIRIAVRSDMHERIRAGRLQQLTERSLRTGTTIGEDEIVGGLVDAGASPRRKAQVRCTAVFDLLTDPYGVQGEVEANRTVGSLWLDDEVEQLLILEGRCIAWLFHGDDLPSRYWKPLRAQHIGN